MNENEKKFYTLRILRTYGWFFKILPSPHPLHLPPPTLIVNPQKTERNLVKQPGKVDQENFESEIDSMHLIFEEK